MLLTLQKKINCCIFVFQNLNMAYPNDYENSVSDEEAPKPVQNEQKTNDEATQQQEAVDEDNDHFEDETLKFSIKQMCIDFYYLDKSKILWEMVFYFVVGHFFAVWGCYNFISTRSYILSFIFNLFYGLFGAGLGVTMGLHRYFSHKSFEARTSIKVLLMLMNSIAFQESIYIWSRNHRVHHKWADTDRDFTNSRRGFFFAHMGWKMYEEHPQVQVGRELVPCNDLLNDRLVMFQHDYYYWITIPMVFIIPTLIPVLFWEEPILISFTLSCFRLALSFHITWCINSVAHLYGNKPYDKTIHAFESAALGMAALGEGWHNFHHTFPRDYRASEMNGWGVNLTTNVIELAAKYNLVYNLNRESDAAIEKRTQRTGNPAIRFRNTKT